MLSYALRHRTPLIKAIRGRSRGVPMDILATESVNMAQRSRLQLGMNYRAPTSHIYIYFSPGRVTSYNSRRR